jgi:hypothetical protein
MFHESGSEPRRPSLTPWVAGLILLLLVGLAAAFLPPVVRHRAFRAERDRIQALLKEIQSPSPPEVSPEQWQHAWEVVYNGFGNVCFTERQVSTEEMRRLRMDLEALLRGGPVDLKTLEKVWMRLGQTGPHGAEYTSGKRPLLDEALR